MNANREGTMNGRSTALVEETRMRSDGVRRAVESGPGPSLEIRTSMQSSPVGLVLIGRSNLGLCAVLLGDDEQSLRTEMRERFPAAKFVEGGTELHEVAAEVVALLEGAGRMVDLPLDTGGTEFQRIVWSALRTIPFGRTASYSEIAARIGRPGSVRAVASACGANRLAIVIPCHRVVQRGGGLGGYRWGLERKRALLRMEGSRQP